MSGEGRNIPRPLSPRTICSEANNAPDQILALGARYHNPTSQATVANAPTDLTKVVGQDESHHKLISEYEQSIALAGALYLGSAPDAGESSSVTDKLHRQVANAQAANESKIESLNAALTVLQSEQ
ncbi:hypothetical protein CBOM_01291 [Ceraceosorus bombacis]|uniref:Uncharacterized protein n=1 Tax=Ceraceosorus bombacis TaxID=401625 RepID=A0A0P1BBY8_9BASI|nr:hypothetical protein CBOM_01291 [Ceraceosorus bombacis]